MKPRSINKILLAIILVLLVANVVMLYLFIRPQKQWQHRDKSGSDSGMAPVLREKVGFTEKQIADYMNLRSQQKPELRNQFSQMRNVKDAYYKTIFQPVSDSVALSLADSIGYYQKSIDMNMRNYFLQIRQLCTPEQLPQFDSALSRITLKMIGKPSRGNSSSKK